MLKQYIFPGETMEFLEIKLDQGKKILSGLLVISVFIFLVTVLVFVYAFSGNPGQIPSIFLPFLQYHIESMLAMGFFGVLSGLIFYSITHSTIQKQEKIAKNTMSILLKFLAGDDKALIQLLLEKGGVTTQSEVAKVNGMGRLRAHRTAKKLEERGIIRVEKHGKMNLLKLSEELKINQ